MTTGNNFTMNDLTRQEQLIIWLRRADMKIKDIAVKTGVTSAAVSKWFDGDTMPPFWHEKLLKMGIPAALLPEPVLKSGGKAYPMEAETTA